MEGRQCLPIPNASDIHDGPESVHSSKCGKSKAGVEGRVCDPKVREWDAVLELEDGGRVQAGEVCDARVR